MTPQPPSYQIRLPEAEMLRLANRVEDDMQQAWAAHDTRVERWRSYLQRWQNRVSAPAKGKERKPNHTVPLVQWQVFQKLARDMQAIVGQGAEVTAEAVGDSDYKMAAKVGAYMTNRLFSQMKITNPMCVHTFQRILYGRSIVHRPWIRKEYDILEQGQRKRVCYYEGPGFIPERPENIITAPERDVADIQDFSYVIRRRRVTVDELRRGDGTLYQGTNDPEFLEQAMREASSGYNDYMVLNQGMREEREHAEGVDLDSPMLSRRGIWMWEWYGYWRPLKKIAQDAEVDDLRRRADYEADWVVRFIPGMKKIVGVQDLMELYPKMRRRRPFSDSALIQDGSYYGMGFGRLLEDLEDEATSISRMFAEASELSVWPIVFYRPGSGFKPGPQKLSAGMAYPTEDPSGVNVIHLQAKLEHLITRQQETLAIGERTTGINDQSMGRSIERPNAPRTATGQLALIEEGNVRAYLDATILREDMERMTGEIWEMDSDLAPKTQPGIFFRVTEQQSNGAFDTVRGGAYMTPKEFGGGYDFKLKFAVSVYSKEARAQKVITFYQLAMANPLVMNNPRALWNLLHKVAKEFDIDLGTIIPEPPALDEPRTPELEWTMMLQGEADEVKPNPQDMDDQHLMKHEKQLEEWRKDPDRDEQAGHLLIAHIQATRSQAKEKMLMQAMTAELAKSIAPIGALPEDGQEQGAPAPDPAQMQQNVGNIFQPAEAQRPMMPTPTPPGQTPQPGVV